MATLVLFALRGRRLPACIVRVKIAIVVPGTPVIKVSVTRHAIHLKGVKSIVFMTRVPFSTLSMSQGLVSMGKAGKVQVGGKLSTLHNLS